MWRCRLCYATQSTPEVQNGDLSWCQPSLNSDKHACVEELTGRVTARRLLFTQQRLFVDGTSHKWRNSDAAPFGSAEHLWLWPLWRVRCWVLRFSTCVSTSANVMLASLTELAFAGKLISSGGAVRQTGLNCRITWLAACEQPGGRSPPAALR